MFARQTKKLAVFALLLILSSGGSAEEAYQLGWDQINKANVDSARNYTLDWQAVERKVERRPAALTPRAPVAVMPAATRPRPARSTPPQQPVVVKPEPIPSYNIEVAASRFYDAYAERYKMVTAVQVATNRNGNTFCELFENIGEYNQYEVFLNDLKPGDSYSATIIWDDGSNRTIEKTIGGYNVEESIFVDEPDLTAYTIWQ